MQIFDVNFDKLDFNFSYNKKETQALSKLYSHNYNITINDIRRIVLWKLDRVISIDDTTIEFLHKIATEHNLRISSELSLSTIQRLTKCEGVGFPMASTILKFIRPDIYPIIDVRAYRALFGKKISYSQYNISKYLEYSQKIYMVSEKLNIPLNTVDEQLYLFDKNTNGKI